MTWKRDTRPENVRTIGDFKIFSEVNSDRETAHVIQFPDGAELRVLPSGQSGRMRSITVRSICEGLAEGSDRLRANEALLVAIGGLSRVGLDYQELAGAVSIEEWLDEWLEAGGSAENLLHELDVDGWEIRRKGET